MQQLTFKTVYAEQDKDGNTAFFMLRRKFLGRLDNFFNVDERAFEKRNLRAYLKGKSIFTYGTEPTHWNTKQPQRFKVAEGVAIEYLTPKQVKKLSKRPNTKFEVLS